MTDELVKSGVTAFAPPPSPSYRCVISCKADQICISLEDQKSKKQWRTGYLAEDSYLTSTNRIGNAAVADYVLIFKEALDYLVITDRKSDLNTKKTRRNLILMDGGLQLEFSVKIKVRQSACAAKFVFNLALVSRIRTLETKLQEVEGELAVTRACLQEAQVVFLEGSTQNWHGRLQWKPTQRCDFEVTDDGSAIRFLVAGWYVISLVMFLAPQPVGAYIELLRNDEDLDLGNIVPFNGDRDVGVGAGITITKIGN